MIHDTSLLSGCSRWAISSGHVSSPLAERESTPAEASTPTHSRTHLVEWINISQSGRLSGLKSSQKLRCFLSSCEIFKFDIWWVKYYLSLQSLDSANSAIVHTLPGWAANDTHRPVGGWWGSQRPLMYSAKARLRYELTCMVSDYDSWRGMPSHQQRP